MSAEVETPPIKVGDTVYRREMSDYWKPEHGFITRDTVKAVSSSGRIATRLIKTRGGKVLPVYAPAFWFYRTWEAARAALIEQRQEKVERERQALIQAEEYLADVLAIPETEPE
jgi:hypothetical protein